jgi:hypothetical protein
VETFFAEYICSRWLEERDAEEFHLKGRFNNPEYTDSTLKIRHIA